MIVMLDTSEDLAVCATELRCRVEQLFTPLTRRKPQTGSVNFAIDNGAYSRFDPAGFERLLDRLRLQQHWCRFVAVPDVVGSAIRTSEVFAYWHRLPTMRGWPLAYVCQDGQDAHPIPWPWVRAVFIGGSTDFKMGPVAAQCIKAAQAMGKWTHVGRVNTPGRFEYFEKLGVDSIDGTGLARYSHMRERVAHSISTPQLFDTTTEEGNDE